RNSRFRRAVLIRAPVVVLLVLTRLSPCVGYRNAGSDGKYPPGYAERNRSCSPDRTITIEPGFPASAGVQRLPDATGGDASASTRRAVPPGRSPTARSAQLPCRPPIAGMRCANRGKTEVRRCWEWVRGGPERTTGRHRPSAGGRHGRAWWGH